LSGNDLRYWIGFNKVSGIGAVRLRTLLDHFGTIEAAWKAPAEDLQAAGLDRHSAGRLVQARRGLNLDAELERLARGRVHVLTWDDPTYPRNLREVYAPPPVLYVRGKIEPHDEFGVAVVGTRRASVYGKEAARMIAEGLAQARVTVVSGLAMGIDTVAHHACIAAGGRTLAVLGCGVDVVYPAQNARLAAEIVDHGALVSEYPMGTQPDARNFPPRNRIISGLALGTVVVEADIGSGARITADFAGEQGRDVFAVPGNIFARGCRGTNRLIQDGAKMVCAVNDILEELNLTMVGEQAKVRAAVPENPTEASLLARLSAEPLHVDELGRALGLPIAQVSSTLALMELKGMVRQVGGMNFVLARESRAEYVIE